MFDVSQRYWERAQRVTPGGAQTASKAPGRVGPIGAFPLYAEKANGPWIWDVDGTRYVDWFNGNCAVTLGHGHTLVHQAITAQLGRGVLLSLPTLLEITVAERLVEQIPCAEQVRFLKTGSEATEAAIRIARMATGRSRILLREQSYHGWHAWSTVAKPFHPGVPDLYEEGIWSCAKSETLVSLLRSGRSGGCDDIAAVIVEPNLEGAHLAAVMAAARENGSLVIFDEMICGNRWHVGGYQAFVDLTPDLATFGKAYANGLPLAFVAGPATLMQHAWAVSGTFGGEAVALAACDGVLDAYRREDVIGAIWRAGRYLVSIFNGEAARVGLPARMEGPACRPSVVWQPGVADRDLAVAVFQQELARAGILAHPSGWNPSAAHHAEALAETFDGLTTAIEATAAALDSGHAETFLQGERLRPPFARPA